LGIPTVTRHFAKFFDLSFDLTYGFGLTRVSWVDQQEESRGCQLIYAKIDGKEYGTLLAVVPTAPVLPARCELLQNYPNPFNPSTTISYALPSRSHVTLTVFNALGQQVATLANEVEEAGSHDVRFDGSGLASGVYFYRLNAADYVNTRRMNLVK
jgi:hypothetical protein